MFRRLSILAALVAAVCAQEKPVPPEFTAELQLVRYDMPRGLSDGYAPTRQLAKRRDGPDAIDWPALTFDGRPAFRGGPVEKVPLWLRRDADARSPFEARGDDVIEPGHHWLRAIAWVANRKHIYTADPTARTSATGIDATGRYELWLFPLRIEGEGGPQVKNVVVKVAGAVVFQKDGPWRSLTLLLPANELRKPYEITVAGRGPVKCSVGLAPVKLGNPVERTLSVDARVPGDGPKVRVYTPVRPDEFPNQKEWDADVATTAKFQVAPAPKAAGIALRTTSSPLTIYAAGLPHGMSGGFWKKGMNADAYAKQIGALGFDAVFEPVASLPAPGDAGSLETRAAALGKVGVRLGLQYDQNWTRPDLQHPNLALLAHTLPDWHQPLYRSLQLTAQRFARVPGFLGLMIGGGDAGYAALAPKVAPNPDRPWGEAMIAFMGTPQPAIPRGPTLGPVELPFEQSVKTQAEFMRYVQRYDYAFRQYGYFAEAVRSVDPAQVFTTASFGSSPGAGARGGWPWASTPGRMMFEGVRVQQAYDANTLHSSKPMHLVALIDRLRSYSPTAPTWALVDNTKLFFGREAMQRAYALALTRGVRGIGTNFLPPAGDNTHAELNGWIQRYGAAYAATLPEATIGVFFGALEAVQKPVNTNENAPPDELLRGSHEGKVTEALWLCHAAGWPARVVTYPEIARGPLPTSMKTLLLVGLDQSDATWSWSKGLEPMLQQFIARGGRILLDDESDSPVPGTKTGLRVASYVTQSELDATPRLLARNAGNITKLRAALEGIAPPAATSEDPTMWAVPTRVKDTLYITAVNWAFAEGDEAKEFVRPADPRASRPEVWKTKANASLYVKPRTATLAWHTTRPIYDVRQRRRLTAEEAAQVDFNADGFQWFALPAAEIESVALTLAEPARVRVETRAADGSPLRGVPVEIALFHDDTLLTKLSAVSDDTVTIAPRAANRVVAAELLSGRQSEPLDLQPPPPRAPAPSDAALRKFAARKQVPLVIALTPAQERNPKFVALAKQIAARFEQAGRKARIGLAAPGDVVASLQPLRTPHRFPQWTTKPADLVLIGTPQDNVLMMDQVRGEIFPHSATGSVITKSPFVGEFDVLNIVTNNAASAQAWLAEWK
ncbi:MAG: hypothetical protein ABMA13_04955 [Chthoniobacteraceae bacterium]